MVVTAILMTAAEVGTSTSGMAMMVGAVVSMSAKISTPCAASVMAVRAVVEEMGMGAAVLMGLEMVADASGVAMLDGHERHVGHGGRSGRGGYGGPGSHGGDGGGRDDGQAAGSSTGVPAVLMTADMVALRKSAMAMMVGAVVRMLAERRKRWHRRRKSSRRS